MATRFYLSRKAPSYSPASLRGSWTTARSSFDSTFNYALITGKNEDSSGLSTNLWGKNSTSANFKNANVRLISGAIVTPVTISGTIDAFLSTFAQSLTGRVYTKIYAYVTAGNTATVRGVLLDYVEPDGNSAIEWGKAAWKAVPLTQQTLSSVSASAGDHIVIELGSCDYTTDFTDGSGIQSGTCDANFIPFADDLSSTNTDTTAYAGWIEFSQDLYTATNLRTSQAITEVLRTGDPKTRSSQQIAEVISKGQPKARISQYIFEVISRSYVPGDVPLTVHENVAVNQSLITASDYVRGIETDLTVGSDIQVSGSGIITAPLSQSVTVTPTIDIRIVPLQNVTSSVTVTPSIHLTDAGPHKFLVSNVTVNHTRAFRNTIKRLSVTSTLVVSTSNRTSPKTGSVTSTVVVTPTITNSTPDHAKSVESTVHVASVIGAKGPTLASASSNISVSQGIAFVNSSKTANVTSTVTVTSSIVKRGPVPQTVVSLVTATPTILAVGNVVVSVVSTVNVSSVPDARNAIQRVTVTHPITVNQLATPRNTNILITVTTNIAVNQQVRGRNTNIRIAVASSIGVGDNEDESTNNPKLTQNTLVNIASLSTGSVNPQRASVESGVHVVSTNQFSNTYARSRFFSNVHVTQTIANINPNQTVRSTVTVVQKIGFQSSNPALEIKSNIRVTPVARGRSNFPRKTIQTFIKYLEYNPKGGMAANAVINNPRILVGDYITVKVYGDGGPAIRNKAFSDSIKVNQKIVTNKLLFEVTTKVKVSGGEDTTYGSLIPWENIQHETDAVRGGIQIRNATLKSNKIPEFTYPSPYQYVIVDQTIFALVENNEPRRTVVSKVTVKSEAKRLLPDVEQSVTSSVFVTLPIFRPWEDPTNIVIMPNPKAKADVLVDQIITVGGDRKFVQVQPVIVTSTVKFRVNPVTKHVETALAVNHRALAGPIVHSRINVSTISNLRSYYNIVDRLVPVDSVENFRSTDVSFVDGPLLTDTMVRTVEAERSFEDHLIIPIDSYERETSLGRIVVPIVRVVRVDKFMTLQSGSNVILLPPAEWDDSEGVVGECNVQRSMNGVIYTIIKSTDRRKINYPFKLSLPKANELRLFLIANMSKPMTITDWKGRSFWGYCTSNPFELNTDAKYAGDFERVSVELEFEAVKL